MRRRTLSGIAGIMGLVGGGVLTGAAFQTEGNSLGDVRYSVLDPTHFKQENGEGWELMDGRTLNGTEVCTKHGICTMPDARGMFIRGMNLGRGDGNGDPSGNRSVGALQGDAVKRHRHRLQHMNQGGFDVDGNGQPARLEYDDGPPYQDKTIPLTTTEDGGPETRPKNIALYTYMKVR